MSVPEVDFARWPVVEVRVDATPQPADVAAIAGAVQSALERQTPFGLAVVSPVLPTAIDDAGSGVLRALRRRRAEVGTWCRGVAYVLPEVSQALEAGARADELQWGCDVVALQSATEAHAWLAAQIPAPAAR